MAEDAQPRIAWFTPLRPVESGISHYNEELLPVLATAWQIDVFVDGYSPTHLRSTDTLQVHAARVFHRRHHRRPYDAVVYQMGNSRAHAYMYPTVLEVPGLLVLHDTMLHHLILSMMLTGSRRGYRRLMERHYGEAGLTAAERVLRGQLPKSLFDLPLSEDAVEASWAVAVHSDHARANVLRHNPNARIEQIPMGIPVPQRIARERARRLLGLPEREFLIASVTHVNPYKRLDVVLRVLARLRSDVPARLVIAGSVAPLVPLGRYVSALGLESAVERLDFVDDLTARLVVAASDVCVNLRFPTAGETSASLLRLMGGGRPVLVTGAGSFDELPDGAVIKIPPDVLEEETIFATLRRLASDPALGERIGAEARQFVLREHSLAAMAEGYHGALERVAGRILPRPEVGELIESLTLPDAPTRLTPDPLTTAIADALVELGLGGDVTLLDEAARAAVELGLGVGKMGRTADVELTSGGRGA